MSNFPHSNNPRVLASIWLRGLFALALPLIIQADGTPHLPEDLADVVNPANQGVIIDLSAPPPEVIPVPPPVANPTPEPER